MLSGLCVIGAIMTAAGDHNGWGWFLFAAVILAGID